MSHVKSHVSPSSTLGKSAALAIRTQPSGRTAFGVAGLPQATNHYLRLSDDLAVIASLPEMGIPFRQYLIDARFDYPCYIRQNMPINS